MNKKYILDTPVGELEYPDFNTYFYFMCQMAILKKMVNYE